ncbi:MAG: helix-turn-helix transcriptional regulator [Pseudomonadota bacterium]
MIANLTLLLAGFALSQIFLALIKLLQIKQRALAESLYMALLVAVTSHLLIQIYQPSPNLRILFDFIRTASPGLFWLVCGAIFLERFRLEIWKVGLVLATTLLPATYSLFMSNHALARILLVDAPQLIEFVLILWGLWYVAATFRDDLVQQRRQLRVWVFGFSGLLLFSYIFAQQVIEPGGPWFGVVHLGLSAIYLLVFNLFVLGWRGDIFRAPSPKIPEQQDDPFLARLKSLMEEACYYRQHSLTLDQLAQEMRLAPHKLRNMINGELGFRNFNEFLNSYRLAEAATRLRAEPDEPVINISIDVGFKSLTTFNKTFKEKYNQTPTSYRKTA